MITKRTVLVLGAGASVPFGFPSGGQLLEEICDKLSSENSEEFKFLLLYAPKPRDIITFRDALSRSGQPSVDAFLENRTEFIDVGKGAIAMALLPYERTEALFEGKRPENWYQYLFNLLSTSFQKFDQNKLSIITFNYDRSLEHYLFTALKNTYKLTDQKCAETLSLIPIIHVYGKLGPLPWERIEREFFNSQTNAVPFDSTCDPNLISHENYEWYKNIWFNLAKDNIKIIHEGIEDDKEFNKAHQLLKSAERICFLGFGYHEINLERLRIDSLCHPDDPVREIAGTCYCLSHKQKELVRAYRHPSGYLIDLYDAKVYDFLYNSVVLD